MIRPLLLGLLSTLVLLAGPRDEVDDAVQKLTDALAQTDPASHAAAVQKLIDLGDVRGITAIHTELIHAVPRLDRAERKLEQLRSDEDRQKRQLERRRVNAKDDRDKADVERAEAKFADWRAKDLLPAEKTAQDLRAKRELLAGAAGKLLEKLSADRRRTELQRLDSLIGSDAADWTERVAAMECYAPMGDRGVVTTFLKLGKEARQERKRVEMDLPKKVEDFEKAKVVYHREAAQRNDGKISVATAQLLERAQKEVTELQDRLHGQVRILEACYRLLGVAIAAQPEDLRKRSVAEVIQSARNTDSATRIAAVAALGAIRDEAAVAFLRTAIATTSGDPGTRVAALDSLAAQGDSGALDAILDKCLRDSEWAVRAAAIQALASIRAAKAIPALIAAVENEVGRLRDDANDVLRDLTGLEYATAKSWRSWWEASQKGFEPKPAGEHRARGPREGGTVAFAGIQTSSQNIAFVVDVSGSMNFGLDAEEAAGEGQTSRFMLLKRELATAIERMPDGGSFAMLTFSSFVNRWTPKIETMKPEVRKRALAFVQNEMSAEGSTNIYGALKEAFEIAGRGATDKWYRPAIDTIFFLTDGKPSPDSEVSDPDRILEAVREWNKLGKIAIHVVCLGEADALFLRKLAAQNHGDFAQP